LPKWVGNGKKGMKTVIPTSDIKDVSMFILNRAKLENENGSVEDLTKEVYQKYKAIRKTLLNEIDKDRPKVTPVVR